MPCSLPVIAISAFIDITDLSPNIEIQLEDNGIGMDKNIQEKLFEPFVTTRAKGTGLGLAIVKRIIEEHKGQINIKYEPHQVTYYPIKLLIIYP